ncbi:MAG TPA: xanthine dehydrogenase family protein molybdopterin-binding subunit [Hyphomicrobiaceae bacterium]|nr:xanthine dehydrogenase family protein molybdopterin-binding subunit [Hyphomicrobiaceae bacterium]
MALDPSPPHARPHRVVGKRLPRVDARQRVTGEAIYPADLALPGMVHAKLLRSPLAHARILGIDTRRARALPGVLAVVTAADFPELPVGEMIPMGETGYDMWMVAAINMARDKVHWVGQPVAAVAALDVHTATAALALIEVSYAPLPVVPDIVTAIAADAPVLHDHVFTKGVEPRPRAPSNVCSRVLIARGDAPAALATAAERAQITVSVDTAHQGYLEPQVVVAQVDANGFATVWASTQGQFTAELMIARMLGLPAAKLRVVPLEVGGGFGGKIAIHGEAVAVRLAQMCRRPVKLVFSREEVLQGGSGPAAGALIEVGVAAAADGRLVAIEGCYRMDAGGLPGLSPSLLMQASAALYQCPNLKLEGFDVVTNKPRTEAYRGPGGIQAAFAMEQAIDALCQRLGIDPLEFRKRNASVTGSLMPIGTPFPAIGLSTILDRVHQHSCWSDPVGVGAYPRGRGLALGYWRGTSMTSAAHITIAGDGRPMVTIGTVDLSGTRSTMAQVVAEEFGVPVEEIHIQTGDSKSVGYSDGAAGSRVARTMTAALVEACADALRQLRMRAAEKLQLPSEALDYADGAFRARQPGGAAISLAELMQASLTEGAVVGRGVSSKLPLGVEIGAHVCDVEVDTDTGLVTVLRYTAFQDVGLALNPAAVEGQIEGSVVQGLGWALLEGFDYGADGRLRNASLLDYRMPTALDVPRIDSVIVETPVPNVPYGVRGVGEVPIVPPAAAVANAIARAIGVRVCRMPMTPERVLGAIRGARGRAA